MNPARVNSIDMAGELATLWRSASAVALQRVDCLRRALAAAERDALGVDLRAAAGVDAHKLAGALGMYGLEEASDLAIEADRAVVSGALDHADARAELAVLVERLADAIVEER
jgi:two-component system, OmpR family, response regulator